MKKWNGEKSPWAGVKERSRPLITSPIPARCGKTETDSERKFKFSTLIKRHT